MHRKWITFLFSLLLVFLLAACGGSDEPEDTGAATPDATDVVETPTDVPVVEPTTAPAVDTGATIIVWADDTRAPILLDLADAFQAEYGVTLQVEQVADINDQFVIAAPAGEGPDIFIGPHDRIGGFIDSGLLAPIDLGSKRDSFTDVALDGFTYQGELYGVPYASENLGFFYNTDMVDSPPATWEELAEMGQDLVDAGDAQYAFVLSGTTYDAFPLQTAFGGYIFGQNAGGDYDPSDVGVDGSGMVAAGEYLQENIESGLFSDNVDWDTAHSLFETGEVPFLMAGPWALDRLRESGVPFAVANFPSGPAGEGRPFAGIQGFMINALSENQLLAEAFLTEFVATEPVMRELAESGNRPSAWKSVLADQSDPDLTALGEAGSDAVLMPAIPEMGSVWSSWSDGFALIINGDQSPDEALANAGEQIRNLIGGSAAGMVNIPGSHQDEIGCAGDWDPACTASALSSQGDGTYAGTFTIPAGEYEMKVALDGAWTENYGVDGVADGDNIPYSVEETSEVTFVWDEETKLLEIMVGDAVAGTDDEMMDACDGVDASGEEIVIHQQAGREGPLAAILGDGFALATADVVAHINENGGVCGAELRVEFCETNYNPELEIACYEQFRTSDTPPIVLLSYGSGATVVLKDRVVEDEIVHMVAGLEANAIYNPANGYTVAALPIYSDQFAGFLTWLDDNWDDVKPEGAGDEIVVGVIGWANAFGAGATTDEALDYADSLGITVLDLEDQEISPDADVTGQIQNLLLEGANVIYSQNLSFGTTQVIGTLRALGVWDQIVVGGVNWAFNTDVVNFLGENAAVADGFYGVFPYLWYDDSDNETVALVNEAFEAGEYEGSARAVSYLTTWSSFLLLDQVLEHAVAMTGGVDGLDGAAVLAALEDMGTVTDGVLTIDVTDGSRSAHEAQIRRMTWDGEQIQFELVEDFFELPDTRPAGE